MATKLENGTVLSLEQLAQLTRRDFCRTAGLGIAALVVVPACSSGGGGGGGGGGNPGGTDDAGTDDAGGGGGPDLVSAQTCAPGLSDTGMTPATFLMNTATYFDSDQIFVCRDAMGLYAITAICTHEGCLVTFMSGSKTFYCPCHASRFNFNGAVTRGPAFSPLAHFAVCLTAGGNVGYDPNTPVAASDRLTA